MIISKRKDSIGRTRYYVLPIESHCGFEDLVKFISQEFSCDVGSPDDGPGTTVQRVSVEGIQFVFVLSDSTGAQFYVDEDGENSMAEKVAQAIEKRFREIM